MSYASRRGEEEETAPTRDVTGRWDFRMETGPDRTARGELWLFPRGEEFTGTATVQGRNALPVRMLTLRGERIAMTVRKALSRSTAR